MAPSASPEGARNRPLRGNFNVEPAPQRSFVLSDRPAETGRKRNDCFRAITRQSGHYRRTSHGNDHQPSRRRACPLGFHDGLDRLGRQHDAGDRRDDRQHRSQPCSSGPGAGRGVIAWRQILCPRRQNLIVTSLRRRGPCQFIRRGDRHLDCCRLTGPQEAARARRACGTRTP
jgi:hypothetical protein